MTRAIASPTLRLARLKCLRRSSTHSLALGELETFFNDAWSIFDDVLERNFGDEAYDLDENFRVD